MYITRFTHTDGTVQDYRYEDVKDAAEHLSLFTSDTSGQYKSVAVLEAKSNTVIAILPFSGGIPDETVVLGGKVKLRKEYSTPEEQECGDIYKVVNLNEHTMRADIECLTTDMVLRPIETVGVEMIEVVSEDEPNHSHRIIKQNE